MNNNTPKTLRCSLETRTSKKKGSEYQCVVIKLTENYEKIVFLESAELELLKLTK